MQPVTKYSLLSRGLGTQTVVMVISAGTAQVVLAGVYIVIARYSRPAEFGLIVSAVAVGSAIAGAIDFGSNSYCVREMAAAKMSQEEFGSRLFSKLLFTIAIVGAVSTWVALTQPTTLWTAGPIAICLLLNQSLQAMVRGALLSDRMALSLVVDRLIVACSMWVFALLGLPLANHFWIALVFGSLASSATCWLLTPGTRRPNPRALTVVNPWSGCGHYGLFSMATSALSLDVVLTGIFGGPIAAGLYGAVSRIVQPMSLLAGAFTTTTMPVIAQAVTARAAWYKVRSSLWLIVIAVLVCILVAGLAPWLIEVLIGPKYSDSERVLIILAIGSIPVIFNQILGTFLQARGFDRIVARIFLIAVMIQLLLVCILAHSDGASGGAWAYLVVQTALLVGLGTTMYVIWARRRLSARP